MANNPLTLFKRNALHELKKRVAQMPAGMPLLSAIMNDNCDDDGSAKKAGMKNINFGGNRNSNINNPNNNIAHWKPTTGEIIGMAVGGAVILLAVLSLCILCFRRRAARRRRAVAAAAPKFYPEVSYLYDPPPGAPAPGPGQPLMASQRSVPDTAYTGAAGVAAAGGPAGPEKEGLLGNVPSARSVLAPLSGYARAGQEENPFGDQAAAQYRDSLDHRQ